jgi:hypothetical protein
MSTSVSPQQHELAVSLGINLAADSFDTAAARLLGAAAEALGFESAQPSSEKQRAFAASLGAKVDQDSKRAASAKIRDLLLERSQKVIVELNPKPGDRVFRIHRFEFEGEKRMLEQEFLVFSIQPNGRVSSRAATVRALGLLGSARLKVRPNHSILGRSPCPESKTNESPATASFCKSRRARQVVAATRTLFIPTYLRLKKRSTASLRLDHNNGCSRQTQSHLSTRSRVSTRTS